MAKLSKRVAQAAQRLLRKLMKRSNSYLRDGEKLTHLLAEAMRVSEVGREALTSAKEELITLIRLVKAWRSGEYRRVPRTTLVAITGAILYLVNPFDAIPDFLPGIGYLDDATVLGWLLSSISDDIETFRSWEDGAGLKTDRSLGDND